MSKCWLPMFVAFALSGTCIAQRSRPVTLPLPQIRALPADSAAALTAMAARAGVIFAGRVVSVTRMDASGFVDIRFAIDHAVKGCTPKNPYILREWSGLWTSNASRYVVGERLLLLLAPRGPSGLSAPVDDLAGILPILPSVTEPLADAHGVAPAEDGSDPAAGTASQPVADLRGLLASLPRASMALRTDAWTVEPILVEPDTLPMPPAGRPPTRPAPIAWPGPIAPLPVPANAANAVKGQPSLNAVLAVLQDAVLRNAPGVRP